MLRRRVCARHLIRSSIAPTYSVSIAVANLGDGHLSSQLFTARRLTTAEAPWKASSSSSSSSPKWCESDVSLTPFFSYSGCATTNYSTSIKEATANGGASGAIGSSGGSLFTPTRRALSSLPEGFTQRLAEATRAGVPGSSTIMANMQFPSSLGDTRSGYMRDPTAAPQQYVGHTSRGAAAATAPGGGTLSAASLALVERMAREHDLLHSESQAYAGYTTRAVQRAKAVLLRSTSTLRQVASARRVLLAERERMIPLIGTRALRPLSVEAVLDSEEKRQALLAALDRSGGDPSVFGAEWSPRAGDEEAAGAAAAAASSPSPAREEQTVVASEAVSGGGANFHVVVHPDGTEEIVFHRKRTPNKATSVGSGASSVAGSGGSATAASHLNMRRYEGAPDRDSQNTTVHTTGNTTTSTASSTTDTSGRHASSAGAEEEEDEAAHSAYRRHLQATFPQYLRQRRPPGQRQNTSAAAEGEEEEDEDADALEERRQAEEDDAFIQALARSPAVRAALANTNATGAASDHHHYGTSSETAGEGGDSSSSGGDSGGGDSAAVSYLADAMVEVTVMDVHHVNYLLALACRRLRRFEEAERYLYMIVCSDPGNLDALESLLEIYTGLEMTAKINELMDFVSDAEADMRQQRRAAQQQQQQQQSAVGGSVAAADGGGSSGGDSPAAPSGGASSSDNGGGDTEDDLYAGEMRPIEKCFSILANLVVDAIIPVYAREGEGTASRELLSMLQPIVACLYGARTGYLIEALFQTFDKHYFITVHSARNRQFSAEAAEERRKPVVDHNPTTQPDPRRETINSIADPTPFVGAHSAEAHAAQGVFLAFLKMVIARRLQECVEQPLHFEFRVYGKMYTILRGHDTRAHEAMHAANKAFKLYRRHSALYKHRMLLSRLSNGDDNDSRRHHKSGEGTDQISGGGGGNGEDGRATPASSSSTETPPPSTAAEQTATSGEEEEGSAETSAAAAATATSTATAGGDTPQASAAPPEPSPPPPPRPSEYLALDDIDAEYQNLYCMYVNDAARADPTHARRLCLEAVEELPLCAAPWETYAFVLYVEEPKRNLANAIRVARYAFTLDPLRLSTIALLATLFEADRQPELCAVMSDRFRLLQFMAEAGATRAEMLATADEVQGVLQEYGELGEAGRRARREEILRQFEQPMREYQERLQQATAYVLPHDGGLEGRALDGPPPHMVPDERSKEEYARASIREVRPVKGRL